MNSEDRRLMDTDMAFGVQNAADAGTSSSPTAPTVGRKREGRNREQPDPEPVATRQPDPNQDPSRHKPNP